MHAIFRFYFFQKLFKQCKKNIYFQTDIFIHMQIENDDIPTIESKNFTIKQESELCKLNSPQVFSFWNQEGLYPSCLIIWSELRFDIFINPNPLDPLRCPAALSIFATRFALIPGRSKLLGLILITNQRWGLIVIGAIELWNWGCPKQFCSV